MFLTKNGDSIKNFQLTDRDIPFYVLGPSYGSHETKFVHIPPLIQKIKCQISSTSMFLSHAGQLQLVSSVFLALSTFFMCTLKIPVTMIKQVDKYRRHCLWRGADLNAKKPPHAHQKIKGTGSPQSFVTE